MIILLENCAKPKLKNTILKILKFLPIVLVGEKQITI